MKTKKDIHDELVTGIYTVFFVFLIFITVGGLGILISEFLFK